MIGAGAVGAACASALARAGHRVRALSDPSRSTTAISGGHLLLQSKHPGPHLDMARRSLELLTGFVQGQEEELLFRRKGSLIVAASEEESAGLRLRYEALVAEGLPLEWLDSAASGSLEPDLSPMIVAASYCPLDAQVHPGLLAAAWLRDAVRHGASLTSGARVEGFIRSGGTLCGVVAGGVSYEAGAVVLAAGPWSGELATMAGVSLDLRPRRGVLLRAISDREIAARPLLGARYLEAKFGDAPCEIAFNFEQRPGGECLLGGSREFVEWDTGGVEPVAAAILECGTRYLPTLQDIRWGEPEVGYRPWMPCGLPYIGRCEVPGLYLACGHEGDGITLAAATAERVVQAVSGVIMPA